MAKDAVSEPRDLDREWLRRHITEEREVSDLLGTGIQRAERGRRIIPAC